MTTLRKGEELTHYFRTGFGLKFERAEEGFAGFSLKVFGRFNHDEIGHIVSSLPEFQGEYVDKGNEMSVNYAYIPIDFINKVKIDLIKGMYRNDVINKKEAELAMAALDVSEDVCKLAHPRDEWKDRIHGNSATQGAGRNGGI